MPRPLPTAQIVHEGRGGHLEIEGRRYPIEHVAEGRFSVHVPARAPVRHRAAIDALIAAEPDRWARER